MRTPALVVVVAAFVSVVGAAGCDDPASAGEEGEGEEGEGEEGEGEEGEAGDDVSFYGDVLPLFKAHCQECHVDGGIAPFALVSAEDAASLAPLLVEETQTLRMPPFPPGPLSPKMRDELRLTDAEKDILVRWAAAAEPLVLDPTFPQNLADLEAQQALPIGDPTTTPVVEPPPPYPFDADVVLEALPEGVTYTPRAPADDPNALDDFRCFIAPLSTTEDEKLVGFNLVPGERSVVHHVILFTFDEQSLAGLQELDDADDDAGFACPGGVDGGDADSPVVPTGTLAAWTPGNDGVVLYPGTGTLVKAGSVVVFQMHYNFTNGALPDRTHVELTFADDPSSTLRLFGLRQSKNRALVQTPIPVDAVDYEVTTGPQRVGDALNPVVAQALERAGNPTLRAVGVAAHGHLIMTRFQIVKNEGAADEKLLLDIPDWDFHWQGQWTFEDPIDLDVDDTVSLKCFYDNTAERYAEVGLDPAALAPVFGGESTFNEMCIGGVSFYVDGVF